MEIHIMTKVPQIYPKGVVSSQVCMIANTFSGGGPFREADQ